MSKKIKNSDKIPKEYNIRKTLINPINIMKSNPLLKSLTKNIRYTKNKDNINKTVISVWDKMAPRNIVVIVIYEEIIFLKIRSLEGLSSLIKSSNLTYNIKNISKHINTAILVGQNWTIIWTNPKEKNSKMYTPKIAKFLFLKILIRQL